MVGELLQGGTRVNIDDVLLLGTIIIEIFNKLHNLRSLLVVAI
jgi:hypothetical protein